MLIFFPEGLQKIDVKKQTNSKNNSLRVGSFLFQVQALTKTGTMEPEQIKNAV